MSIKSEMKYLLSSLLVLASIPLMFLCLTEGVIGIIPALFIYSIARGIDEWGTTSR